MKIRKTSNQTIVAIIKPLNSPTALAFSVVYNTVRNAMCFIKLRYLYLFVHTSDVVVYWANGNTTKQF